MWYIKITQKNGSMNVFLVSVLKKLNLNMHKIINFKRNTMIVSSNSLP